MGKGNKDLQRECYEGYEGYSPPTHVGCHGEWEEDAEDCESLLVVD